MNPFSRIADTYHAFANIPGFARAATLDESPSNVLTLKPGRWWWIKPPCPHHSRFVGLEHITPENLHIRSWGLVVEGTTFTNYFKPGQVLFGKRRAYQHKVAMADFEGVCSR